MVKSVRMGHTAIEVENIKNAAEFFSTHFQFDVIYTYDDWGLLRHKNSGDDLALLIPGGKHHPHLGIRVASNQDVDDAFKSLSGSTAQLKTQPKLHRDNSYSFYFADPDGNLFEVIFDPSNP